MCTITRCTKVLTCFIFLVYFYDEIVDFLSNITCDNTLKCKDFEICSALKVQMDANAFFIIDVHVFLMNNQH